MLSFVASGAVAFLVSLLLTLLVRSLAQRAGWVDAPSPRKIHRLAVPRLGGVAVFPATVGALLLFQTARHYWRGAEFVSGSLLLHLLLPTSLVFAVGIWDDIRALRWPTKLAGEVVAALWLCSWGIRVNVFRVPGQGSVLLHLLAYPITVLWMLLSTNGINLVDGMDGLATGIALAATGTLMMAGLLTGNTGLVAITVPLAGALLAFLWFNFNPASIFLGDSGSLTVGFLLGACGVIWSQKATATVALAVPVLSFGLPIVDSGLAISRRFLAGKALFLPDLRHIHHRLKDRGASTRQVVVILYGASAVLAAVSLLVADNRVIGLGLAVLALTLLSWFGIRYLQYEEFEEASYVLGRRLGARDAIAELLRFNQLAARSVEIGSSEDLWLLVCELGRTLRCEKVELRWGDLQREWRPAGETAIAGWELVVPLATPQTEKRYLRLVLSRDSGLAALAPGRVARVLQQQLQPQCRAWLDAQLETAGAGTS